MYNIKIDFTFRNGLNLLLSFKRTIWWHENFLLYIIIFYLLYVCLSIGSILMRTPDREPSIMAFRTGSQICLSQIFIQRDSRRVKWTSFRVCLFVCRGFTPPNIESLQIWYEHTFSELALDDWREAQKTATLDYVYYNFCIIKYLKSLRKG